MALTLRQRLTKTKNFQALGNSIAVIIPSQMIQLLDWNLDTRIQLEVHPVMQEIVIMSTSIVEVK